MTKGTIVFVVGDAGAANEMGLVAPILSDPKRGWNIQWFCDKRGKAAVNWKNKGIPFETREPTPLDTPKLVLVGVSSKAAGLGNAWIEWAQAKKIPAGFYSDLPGTDNRDSMKHIMPDFNLVTSAIHAKISEERRPNVPLHIVGKPTCVEDRDRLKDRERLLKEVRPAHGLKMGDLLITYLSGGESEIRAKEQLYAVADAVKELGQSSGRRIFLESRLNPVLNEEARKEMMEVLRAKLGSQVYPGTLTTFEAVFAADLVVGDWGCTDTTRSAACGNPTIIFTNFPEDRARLEEAFGPSMLHPLLWCEAANEIATKQDCTPLLRQVLRDIDYMRAVTWKNAQQFRNLQEPGAAEKIADVLEQIINERTAAA